MPNLQAGQIVFSNAGRDSQNVFVIISVNGEYAYLADGKLRCVQKPKKKKKKHLQPVNFVDMNIIEKINKNNLLDSDARKAVAAFKDKAEKAEDVE